MGLDQAILELSGHRVRQRSESLLCPYAHFTDEMGAGGLERKVGLPSVPSQQLAGSEEQWAWYNQSRRSGGLPKEANLVSAGRVVGSITVVLYLPQLAHWFNGHIQV